MRHVIAAIAMIVISSPAWAQDFTKEALVGRWEFMSYAEAGTPDDRTKVGIVYDFRDDGKLIAEMSSGDREWAYRVDGETVFFEGPRGEQVWQVQSFEPDGSMVLVDQTGAKQIKGVGTLMFMEKR